MVSTVVITGIDNFKIYKEKNEVSFWMMVKNLPEMVVAVAKNIDKENYEPDCFGFQYNYGILNKNYYIKKENGLSLYYLDYEGEKHYIEYEIPDNLIKSAIKKCNKVLQEKGIKKRKKVAASKLAMKKKKKPNVAVNVTPKLYLSMIDPNVGKKRDEARANKDWATSDKLRDQLKEMGITIQDTPQGTRWPAILR